MLANLLRKSGLLLLALALLCYSSCDKTNLTENGSYPPYEFFPMPGSLVDHYQKITSNYKKAYYVALTGSDLNDGSIKKPFCTIQKAINVAKAGEAVLIRGGVYSEHIIIEESGTLTNPIIVSAFPKEEVIIDGKLLSGFGEEKSNGNRNWESGLIQLNGAKNIVISGLKIINSSTSGIYCGGTNNAAEWTKISENITIYNCTIEDCLAPAICFGADYSPSKNIYVIANGVTNCSQLSREAISLRTTDGFEVAYNNVRQVKKESIDVKCGCTNGEIHHNIVSDVGLGSDFPACGIYLDAWAPKTNESGNQNYSTSDGIQQNVKVYSNIVKNLTHPNGNASAIAVASESGNHQENIHIYNNLIFNQSTKAGAGIKIANNGDMTTGLIKNIFVYNNTIYGTDQQALYVNYPNVKNILFANNIALNSNAPAFCLLNQTVSANVITKHNLVSNTPRYKNGDQLLLNEDEVKVLTLAEAQTIFSSAPNSDFSLAKNSPAIDYAYEEAINGIKPLPHTDINDTPRPLGVASDIGAYESF